ncbi:uncharacterized protein TNCV_4669911 [Trichonephila clavipes]|nr:uncharacterized protein TNCV_4669911 [Trichonephila clavipes]
MKSFSPSRMMRSCRGSTPINMATNKKQRKTEDENLEFKVEWTKNLAFIQNLNGLLTCLICKEKFAHNKKSNLERHFTRKHASFSTKYPTGDARKKAVDEIQKSQVSSTSVFNNWMQSSSNINMRKTFFFIVLFSDIAELRMKKHQLLLLITRRAPIQFYSTVATALPSKRLNLTNMTSNKVDAIPE